MLGFIGCIIVGQLLILVGQFIIFGDFLFNEVLFFDGRYFIVSNNGQGIQFLQVIKIVIGKVVQIIFYKFFESLYMGLVFSFDGMYLFVSVVGNYKICMYYFDCGKFVEISVIQMLVVSLKFIKVNLYLVGFVVMNDSKCFVVVNQFVDVVFVIDLVINKIQMIYIGYCLVWVIFFKDFIKVFVFF